MTDFLDLTRELCGHSTGIVTEGNKAFFDRVDRELPLQLFSYRSGEEFNGWVVPHSWKVVKAEIRKEGEVVFDGTQHRLGVAHYSRSFRGTVNFDELKAHLFSNPNLPDAYMWHCSWLYRPWEEHWGFSAPHKLVASLGEGEYEIDLVTSFDEGEMLIAHHDHAGKSNKTVIFHSNHCHPNMANDGFAGTAVMIRLFQWLATQDTYYTYRLIIGPEHVGTVFYLRDQEPEEINRLVCGVFGEMMGTPGPFKVASTFTGDHAIDQVFRHVVGNYAENPAFVPFTKSVVNDETVWEAPGYEVPFIAVNRANHGSDPFPEYHSSLDSVDLMSHDLLDEFFEIFKKVIFVLENDSRIYRCFDGLIALSNPKTALYIDRIDPAVQDPKRGEESEKWGYLQDCVMRYFDGEMTILDIADKHELPFIEVFNYIKRYQEKGFIGLEHAPIEREPVRRVGR